jgi:hypothetical protein
VTASYDGEETSRSINDAAERTDHRSGLVRLVAEDGREHVGHLFERRWTDRRVVVERREWVDAMVDEVGGDERSGSANAGRNSGRRRSRRHSPAS